MHRNVMKKASNLLKWLICTDKPIARYCSQSSEPRSNVQHQPKQEFEKKIQINFRDFDSVGVYSHMCAMIIPRPIAFVSTISADGKTANLAAFSFFMPVTSKPATLAISITRKRDDSKKDTLQNIEATDHFVVNHVTGDIFKKMYDASYEFESEIDEFVTVGLTPGPSVNGPAPLVVESPISIECKVYNMMEVGDGKYGSSTIVVGEITHAHILEKYYHADSKQVLPEYIKTVSRLDSMNYGYVGKRFTNVDSDVWSMKHW